MVPCHYACCDVQLLGSIFQEFLTRKEDYLRALRGFVREVVRVVRNEFNYTTFVRSLMQERTESEFTQMEPSHKVRAMHGGTCGMDTQWILCYGSMQILTVKY